MIQDRSTNLTSVFHALGDPTRMALLQRIRNNELPVSILAEPLGISLPATLKHIRILERAGLVTTTKVGRERRCRVKTEALDDVQRWIEQTRQEWNARLDHLETYLQEQQEQEGIDA